MSDVDLTAFLRQLDTYVAVSSQSCAVALNKKARDLAYTAAKETPIATPAQIKADLLKDPHLLAALTSKRLKGKRVPKPEFRDEMKNLLAARQSGARYLRSGWAPCIGALGGSFRGGASNRGIHSYAKKATGLDPVAMIVHVTDQPNERKQEGAEKVVEAALERAIEFQIADMEIYITRKLSEVLE